MCVIRSSHTDVVSWLYLCGFPRYPISFPFPISNLMYVYLFTPYHKRQLELKKKKKSITHFFSTQKIIK